MSTAPRLLGVGVALGLAAGLLAGAGLSQPGRAAAAAPSSAASSSVSGAGTGGPEALPPVTTGGSAVASSGAAIAYPYVVGSPGVAPDHTIVVTGVAQADLKSDGSDRAAAQKTALAAALADARAQADAIAANTGLSISGVLSVSAAVSPSYGMLSLAGGSGAPSCIVPAPGTGPQASGGTVAPQPACPPTYPQPYQQTLSVAVTVEYRVG